MYTSVDFTSQIVGQRGVPCPTNKGVSYTNLVWLGRDLKNRLLLLLLFYDQIADLMESLFSKTSKVTDFDMLPVYNSRYQLFIGFLLYLLFSLLHFQ
jgi:hypothetical protein